MTSGQHHPSASSVHCSRDFAEDQRNDNHGRAYLMRAIVVSRYPVCREGLGRLIGALPVSEEVAGFSTLAEAVASLAGRPADLLVFELDEGGLQTAELKAAVAAMNSAPVVLFAMLSPSDAQAAYESGVKGCVPKTTSAELFLAALKLILAGGLYFNDLGEAAAKPRP